MIFDYDFKVIYMMHMILPPGKYQRCFHSRDAIIMCII